MVVKNHICKDSFESRFWCPFDIFISGKILQISCKPIVKTMVKVEEKFWTYLDVESEYGGMVA
jgi:hypothetical protein